MNVVVGTYNHTLIGFNFTLKDRENSGKEQWIFSPKFTDQEHDGCIKAVAICGKYLASGSSDEVIRLFDLKKNVDLGSLQQHNGSITDLAFSSKSHLLSASDDGTICIWKCKDWDCVKTLNGHRNSVNSISIHPSGRLLLSVSKDKTIRTWNLLTGRSAYTTNLSRVGELVAWSPSGDSYAVVSSSTITSYSISDSNETSSFSCPKAILSIDFITEDIIILGGELDDIIIYDLKKKETIQTFKAHNNRVKSLKSFQHPSDDKYSLIFSVCSDGTLRAWCLNMEEIQESPQMLAEIHVPGRPVCMTVASMIL